MRAKPCILGLVLLPILTLAGTKQMLSAATTLPATATHGKTVRWKSIPEDASTWQREPFKNIEEHKPVSGPVVRAESPELALQGILKINKHYYAIINGRTIKTGNHIDGWTVTKISRYRVTLRREKETQVFDIYQGKIDRGNR